MQDKLQGLENTSAVTERRACVRLRVSSLMYVAIGGLNGGIVTSLSEKGLSLTAADTLAHARRGDGPLRMRIQFPGDPQALEASGQIVWTSPSGKEGRVRFVELGEKARDQIRIWISNQISSNGLRQGPPRLPKMQLPNSRGTKKGASRFSFADVASSRVDDDVKSGSGLAGFSGRAGELDELPPLRPEAVTSRGGAEAVASAFESPAFADAQTQEAHSGGREQRTSATADDHLQQQPSPAIPERRQQVRRQILLFTYAVLGDDNGGLVFNLGEGGMAFTAAAALQERHFAKIRVRFPDSADWFETSGRLAWQSDSAKEAGIEFLNLAEEVRTRIREWVSQAGSAEDAGSKQNDARTSQSEVRELPHFMDPEETSAEPFEIPASFQEPPFEDQTLEERHFDEREKTPAPPSSALFKSGIKRIFGRASIRRRVAKIEPPQLTGVSAKPRTRVAPKALSIAAGIALAAGGWMLLQRTSLNEASGIIAQNAPYTQSSYEPVPQPDVQPKRNTSENATARSSAAKSSVGQIERSSSPLNTTSTVASPASGLDRTPKEKPRGKDALAYKLLANSPPRISNQAQRPAPSQAAPQTRSSQVAVLAARPSASVPVATKIAESKPPDSKPSENKPAQAAQVFPAQNGDLTAAQPSLSSNPSQPAPSPAVDLGREKLSAPPSTPPEPLLARTPIVTVNFDPYPSIRMPKVEKSKKSQQGKSLQMGRLLARVDPVYPEEAKQQGVEGTARVHAIFNRDGSVQSVISLSGPPMLVTATMKAVQQWRYSQTILGGQGMETQEDVTVLFHLTNSTARN